MVTDIKQSLVSDSFFSNQGISLACNGDSFVSDGRCDTTLTHPHKHTHLTLPLTCFFSCGSRSHSPDHMKCCVPHKKTIHLHILAQQVARAFVVVSCTDEHHLTSHSFNLHSGPTNNSTINQTSIDVIFTRRSYFRRSIEIVYRSCAGFDSAYTNGIAQRAVTTNERSNFVSVGSAWASRKLVERSNGVSLLSSRRARPTGRSTVQFTI